VRSIALPSWIERAAGLEPRAIPPHAFALSRQELAYASFSPGEAAAAPAFRTLLEAQSVTLPSGLFGEGPLGVPVGDSASFAAAVRTLIGRLSRAPKEAALVLPDAWVRGLMIESAELPDEPAARREVLRFRLKRLVPFRTEDLRVAAVPLGAGDAVVESEAGNGSSGRNEGRRAFANFANEALLEVIESGFSAAGVRVGWISGATAALHAGLVGALAPAPVDEGDVEAILGLAHVDSDGFTFVVSRGGEPVVWRQKSFTEGLADADRERLLTAELRLTRTFLEDRLPGRTMGALFLSAPAVVEPFWQRVLLDGLGVAPLRLRPEHVGFAGGPLESGADSELLALAGAVTRKVG
jgi:hypothetical protein